MTANIDPSKLNSEIMFHSGEDWVMKLTPDGIFFNRDRWTKSSADEFAQAVIVILEKEFDVKFNRKEPPYNREEK